MVSGILINKYVRKVEKGDEFPNKNFWKDFPGLVKVSLLVFAINHNGVLPLWK